MVHHRVGSKWLEEKEYYQGKENSSSAFVSLPTGKSDISYVREMFTKVVQSEKAADMFERVITNY